MRSFSLIHFWSVRAVDSVSRRRTRPRDTYPNFKIDIGKVEAAITDKTADHLQ